MASQLLGIKTRFTNDLGSPLVGGQVYTYFAGTSTNQDSYSDAALTVPNTNPVILDDTGSADIFLKGVYRIRVFNASGQFIEEQDNVTQSTSQTDTDLLSGKIGTVEGELNKTNNALIETNTALDRVKFDDGISTTLKNKIQSAIARTQAEKNTEQVSVKDFGALGDNTGVKVVHWYTAGSTHYRGYADLAAVQVDYPHVTSADDTIDWASCQAALNSAANKIYAESGTYVFNRPLRTRHTGSYYRNDTGQTLFGDGQRTVFTRLVTATPATRVPATATDAEKLAADIANSNEATLAVHGSNNIFYGFRLGDGAVGLYLGQDYSVTEDASVCHNSFDNILIRRCGTGYISACANGNHYNDFGRIHFVECQIDAHLKNGGRWVGSNNNNRNTYYKIRSARSRVGLWIESGDSNVIYSWHGEGCGSDVASNNYPVPTDLPESITSGVHIIGGQLNRVFGSQMEDCEIELYNYGYNNEFYGNGYHEGVASGTQVINKSKPAKFISQFTMYMPNFAVLSNPNELAFPGIPAGSPVLGGTTLRQQNAVLEQKNPLHTNTARQDAQFELGAITANTATPINIWKSVSAAFSAAFKITVTASNSTSNLSYITTATVTALRSSSGTLIRYYLSNVSSSRASGAGTGDSGEVVALSLTASGKDLLLNVTAPTSRDLTASAVHVESLITKS